MILIHEYTIAREGLRLLVGRGGNIKVIGEGSTCDDALELLNREFAETSRAAKKR